MKSENCIYSETEEADKGNVDMETQESVNEENNENSN